MAQRMCKVRPNGPNVPDLVALESAVYAHDYRSMKEGEEKLVPLTPTVRKWIKNGTLIPCCPVAEAAVPLHARKLAAQALAAEAKSKPAERPQGGSKKGSDQ